MDAIAAHAERHPDRAALIEGDRRLSWAGFRDARNRLAHALIFSMRSA
jgi:non-ribosomal peptide synthetase component E (peptide arylation enzyme)